MPRTAWFGEIDATDRQWQWFVADQELDGFGDAYGALLYDRQLLIVTDPPVAPLSGGAPDAAFAIAGISAWREIPAESAATLEDALVWIRKTFTLRPATSRQADRLLTRAEAADDPPRSAGASEPYFLARRRTASLRVEVPEFPDRPSQWLTDCEAIPLVTAQNRYAEIGGTVFGPAGEKDVIPPKAMYHSAVGVANTRRPRHLLPGSHRWHLNLRELDDGDASKVSLMAGIALPSGGLTNRYWGEMHASASNGTAAGVNDLPRLELSMSEAFLSLTGDQLFIDMVQRAIQGWPSSKAVVSFGRVLNFGPWIAIVPEETLSDSALQFTVESGLFDIVARVPAHSGHAIWLQTASDPRKLTAARAADALKVLEEVGIETAQRFFSQTLD